MEMGMEWWGAFIVGSAATVVAKAIFNEVRNLVRREPGLAQTVKEGVRPRPSPHAQWIESVDIPVYLDSQEGWDLSPTTTSRYYRNTIPSAEPPCSDEVDTNPRFSDSPACVYAISGRFSR